MTDVEQASRDFVRAAERSTINVPLYALSEEYVEVFNLLEDPDVDPDLVNEALDRIGGQIAQKAEAITGLIRWFEGLAELRRIESKRMAETAGPLEHRAERLRAYLLKNMQAMREATGKDRIDTSRFTISIRLNPPRVEVLEAMLVPHEFQREKIIIDTDKTAIREHWKKTGEVVPGVEIVRGERLEIR